MSNLSGLSDSELYLEFIVDKIQHTTSTLECIGILRKFGKLAFEAGRRRYAWGPWGTYYKDEYDTFKDYLKELYDKTRSSE
jgi:hypothetical protein